MSRQPLNLNGLSPVSESEDTASASPARGRETRTALLQKLRPPPLIHAWDFWVEKPQTPRATDHPPSATTTPAAEATTAATSSYDTRFSLLHSVTDVRTFWTLFNNFSFSSLPPSTAVHLFHKSVLPQWEHPRNTHGGCWTFRLPRATASSFFRALALLAIGEQLQEAVTVDPEKMTFRDDICGISFVVKNTRVTAVQVWNRDAGNEEGIRRVLECVLAGVPAECKPREGQYYYKRHKDHAGFNAGGVKTAESPAQAAKTNGTPLKEVEEGGDETSEGSEEVSRSVLAVEQEYEKVRKILEEVKASDVEMEQKVAADAEREESRGT